MNCTSITIQAQAAIWKVVTTVVLTGCAVTYQQPPPSAHTKIAISSDQSLVIATPEITYRGVSMDTARDPEKGEILEPSSKQLILESDIGRWAVVLAREELVNLGLSPALTKKSDQSIEQMCVRTTTSASEAASLIWPICSSTGADLVICQHLNIELGKDARWETTVYPLGFYSTPTSTTSSAYMRAVARQCETGADIWRGEVFYRGSPAKGNVDFESSLRRLFQTIIVQRGAK